MRTALAAPSLRCLAGLLIPFAFLPAALADIASAERALAEGRADDAIHLLQDKASATRTSAYAQQVLCRVFYAEELADSAIAGCERAAALEPNDSNNQMWLGRAYGLKASNAGPLTGLGLARKVRTAFERAAQLDPSNVPAVIALGEFYIAAPSLIGGGLDKARLVATGLERFSPAGTHRLRAMAAEKAKDVASAEVEFRLAVAAGRSPQAWVDLGNFYQRQHQPEKAVAALQAALAADVKRDAALMDIASILTDAHRSPELAERVLRLYLASPEKSEAAPAFKVRVQLGDLLAQRGDITAARVEYTAALTLASAYSPARAKLQGGRR